MNTAGAAARHGDAHTVTLVVTMAIKPEFEAEFLAEVQGFAKLVHEHEPDVLVYALARHPSLAHTYVWLERYLDEAALQRHAHTSYMAEIRPKLRTYLAGPPEMLRLEQVVPE